MDPAKKDTLVRILLVSAWVILTLFTQSHHEPWRDEAQAWLAASSAHTFWELMLRASIECTGPVYYLLIWPWARLFPEAFPQAIGWVSWFGAFLAVTTLTASRLLSLGATALLIFGYLLGFEYAVLARLYGWGSFFLIAGIIADRKNSLATFYLFFSLLILTQINWIFGAGAWCGIRMFSERKSVRRYLFLGLPLIVFLAHHFMGAGMRPFQAFEGIEHLKILTVGHTLGAVFVQWYYGLDIVGIALFLFCVPTLSKQQWKGFCVGFLPYLSLFLIYYGGAATPRHAGPLALVWALVTLSQVPPGPYIKRVYFCLIVSLGFGLLFHWRDWSGPFSEGKITAERLATLAKEEDRSIRLYGSGWEALVVATHLRQVLWHSETHNRGCPFFPEACPTRTQPPNHHFKGLTPPKPCDEKEISFYVDVRDHTPPQLSKGRWQRIRSPGSSISGENYHVYRLLCR